MLSHLQGKLTEAEQRMQHLEATNRILNEASIQAELGEIQTCTKTDRVRMLRNLSCYCDRLHENS